MYCGCNLFDFVSVIRVFIFFLMRLFVLIKVICKVVY